MAEVSVPPVERARKNEQVILQSLAATGQAALAQRMGCHESTVSRMKDGGITHLAQALAHMGLKVVPVGVQCFEPDYVEALRTLARRGLKEDAPCLDWSDVQ